MSREEQMRALESLRAVPDGPLYRLRAGELSSDDVERVISVLEALAPPEPARELDRLMVAMLWDIPLFVETQKERVQSRGGDERLFYRLRGAVFREVHRILGLGHVDHDVAKWFATEEPPAPSS